MHSKHDSVGAGRERLLRVRPGSQLHPQVGRYLLEHPVKLTDPVAVPLRRGRTDVIQVLANHVLGKPRLPTHQVQDQLGGVVEYARTRRTAKDEA